MKNYKTVEDIKADKELQSMSRYAYKKVLLDGKEVIVCRTNQKYEDIIWGGIYDMLQQMNKDYGLFVDACDMASEIRDTVLDKFSKEYGVNFIDVFDEY